MFISLDVTGVIRQQHFMLNQAAFVFNFGEFFFNVGPTAGLVVAQSDAKRPFR